MELCSGTVDDFRGSGSGFSGEVRWLKLQTGSADGLLVRKIATLMAILFVALIFPAELSAGKSVLPRRPLSKPPVYKKFNNKKQKQVKYGTRGAHSRF